MIPYKVVVCPIPHCMGLAVVHSKPEKGEKRGGRKGKKEEKEKFGEVAILEKTEKTNLELCMIIEERIRN